MANKYKVISKKFYNQWRNYDFALGDWVNNLTEFTERLQGNSGETLRLEEQIQVGTIVNENKVIPMDFVESEDIIRGELLDFSKEGLFVGAALSIEFDGETITATVERITNGGTDLVIDSTASTNIAATKWAKDITRTDVCIKVTTRPEYLLYKYGVIPNTNTSPSYLSPLDQCEQSYQLNGITGSYQIMNWSGKDIGSSFGTVRVKFDSTSDYLHTFTITHDFVIPYYKEGEIQNIQNQDNPTDLKRNSSLRYSNGFFFGGDRNNVTLQYEDLGDLGNVGYFGDTFSGNVGDFEVKNYAVSNASDTGKIEVTEVNTITFSIEDVVGGPFVGGEEIILNHSKLPDSLTYTNSRESFDDTWITSALRVTEGAGAIGVGVFSNVTMVLNGGTGELDVSADITYNSDQQDKLSAESFVGVYFTIANRNTSDPVGMNRGNYVVKADNNSKDEDITGLVTGWQPTIYSHGEFDGGIGYSDFNGWDGDFNGQEWTFKLAQSLTGENNLIIGAAFLVVADDSTNETFFELFRQNIPIQVQFDTGFGIQYQILDVDLVNNFNLPSTELINQIKFEAEIPGAPTVVQTFNGSIGFRVPWREWVQNLNVPIQFWDSAEPQKNRNEKSSNYYGGNYNIKTVLELRIASDVDQGTKVTTYYLLSDGSIINDFDVTSNTFTAVTNYFDTGGDPVENLFINEDVRVEIEFSHTLGTIPTSKLEGRIWIEADQGTAQPWDLSSIDDWTDPNNPLVPTDTLLTGNTTLVEVDTVNNLVTLICKVDSSKLVEDQVYNIYGRLDIR
jgi:hypothetical protein